MVAIERPDGLLIERLLDAGLSVVAIHPNQVKAMRPRYSVAGGKSDGFDSFVLAELARTDSHRFRVLVPDSDRTKARRAMTRARESLVRTRVGLANQLISTASAATPGPHRTTVALGAGGLRARRRLRRGEHEVPRAGPANRRDDGHRDRRDADCATRAGEGRSEPLRSLTSLRSDRARSPVPARNRRPNRPPLARRDSSAASACRPTATHRTSRSLPTRSSARSGRRPV